MPLLSTSEAFIVSDSFLSSLYGDDIFRRWKELKDEMKFLTERQYVSWLIDVANHYKSNNGTSDSKSAAGGQDFMSHVKNEMGLTFEGDQLTEDSSYRIRSDSKANEQQISKVEDDQQEERAEIDELQKVETSSYHPADGFYYSEEMSREEILLSSDDGEEVDEGGRSVSAAGAGMSYTGEDGSVSNVGKGAAVLPHDSDMEAGVGTECKRFTCPHCNYSSRFGADVKRHIRSVHEKKKSHQCDYCHYSSSLKAHLKAHLINRHGYKSNYYCQLCGKYMSDRTKLQKHATCHEKT